MKTNPLHLDQFKSWFASEQTFNAFCEMLKNAHTLFGQTGDYEVVPIVVDGTPICGVVNARTVVKERFAERIAEKPEILDELAKSLNEQPEDWKE